MNEDVYSKYYGLLQSSDQWKQFFGNEGNEFQGAALFSDYLVSIKKANGGALALDLIKPPHFDRYLSERVAEDESLTPLATQARVMIDSGQMSEDSLVEFAQIYDEMGFTSFDEAVFRRDYPAALKRGLAGQTEHNETNRGSGGATSSATPGGSHEGAQSSGGKADQKRPIEEKNKTNSESESGSIEINNSAWVGSSPEISESEDSASEDTEEQNDSEEREEEVFTLTPPSIGGEVSTGEISKIRSHREESRPKNIDFSEEEAASMNDIKGLSSIKLSDTGRGSSTAGGASKGAEGDNTLTNSTTTGGAAAKRPNNRKAQQKRRKIVPQGEQRQREGGDTIKDNEQEGDTRMKTTNTEKQQPQGARKDTSKTASREASTSGGDKSSAIPAPVKMAAGVGLGGGAIGIIMSLSEDPEAAVGIINLFF